MKKSIFFTLFISSLCISCFDKDTISDALKPASCFGWMEKEYKVGDEIQFMNCSMNSTHYAWSFGDGETSTQQEPSHVYAKQGTYEIEFLAGKDLNNDGRFDMDDEPDVSKLSITIAPNAVSVELTILSTSSWSVENPTYTPVPSAVVSFYKEYPTSETLGTPDYTLTSNDAGKVIIYDKEINPTYFVVEKDGESNLVNGYALGGKFQTQEEIDGTPHLDNAAIGSYIFIDINQDGILNDSDKGVCEYVSLTVTTDQPIIRDVYIGK